MKNKFLIILSLPTFMICTSFKPTGRFEPVAVLELFTSQGCSSCPPADRLLSETIVNADNKKQKIYALSFHVDYWNHIGWADPFSDKKFSQRQTEYASVMKLNSVYTPQLVVNGTYEFTGSNNNALEKAIEKSLYQPSSVSFRSLSMFQKSGHIGVTFSIEGDYQNSEIHVAMISKTETTSIKRGENGGKSLKNQHVVRQFISIPAVSDGSVIFDTSPVPENNNMSIIAYVQQKNLHIIGAAVIE